MERPIFKPIGTHSEELDTPALVVDLDMLEFNISSFHDRFEGSGVKLRPQIQAHLSTAIAHMQLRAPAASDGIAVSTLGQAETFAQRGFDDILIVNLAVTPSKIARAAALARSTNLNIGADNPRNVVALGSAAMLASSRIGVMVVVRSQGDFIGASPGDAATLARAARETPGLKFAGLMSTGVEPLLEAVNVCLGDGIKPGAVSLILADTQDIPDFDSAITEVAAGSYALMDAASLEVHPDLLPAARILATVMTHQEDGLVWIDAGQKATSIDTGLPSVDGIPGASVSRMSAEHGGMVLEEGASWDVDLGSKVWLVPHNIANTVNVYDFIHATRNDRLEAVWEVAARGRYD